MQAALAASFRPY